MKTKLIFLTFISILFLTAFYTNTATIEGTVLDKDNNELDFAYVKVFKNKKIYTGVQTDMNGKYIIKDLTPDIYDIEASYIGYKSVKKTKISIVEGTNKINFVLNEREDVLEEICIKAYKAPLIKVATTGATVTADEISSLLTKSVSAIAATTAGIGTKDKGMVFREGISSSTAIIVDGIEVSASSVPTVETDIEEETVVAEYLPVQNVGQLTASQWSDLIEWEDWKEVVDSSLRHIEEAWKINPGIRYSVKATGAYSQALPNVKFDLIDKKGRVVWQAISDNNGQAELWIEEGRDDIIAKRIVARYEGHKKTIRRVVPYEEGVNNVRFDADCPDFNKVEIAFVVDATGSMGDEIRYLQSELEDLVNRIEKSEFVSDLSTGAIFYRDKDDSYLVKKQDLSANNNLTLDFIRNQNASGGGDYPEALDLGLEEAIMNQDWSEDALARIVIVLLDAPAHNTADIRKRIKFLNRKAAERGIKVLPILASGSKSESEYLMRVLATVTNSKFIFLTDDSGIGNSHSEPSIGSYEVEFLNDLLFRLIAEMTALKPCEETQELVHSRDLKNQKDILFDFDCYPNPAKDFVMIEMYDEIDKLEMLYIQGKVVSVKGKLKPGTTSFKVYSLPAGMYFIKGFKGDKVKTKKILKVD